MSITDYSLNFLQDDWIRACRKLGLTVETHHGRGGHVLVKQPNTGRKCTIPKNPASGQMTRRENWRRCDILLDWGFSEEQIFAAFGSDSRLDSARAAKVVDDALFEAVAIANEINLDGVKRALEAGAAANATSKTGGLTPLHHVAGWGKDKTATLEAARLLIGRGANVNAENFSGERPLHHAHATLAKLLLQHGAEINALNDFGGTPLCTIASHQDSDAVEAARVLIAHGANVNGGSRPGTNYPLHYADTAMTTLLLQHGAQVDPINEYGETPLLVICSIRGGGKDKNQMERRLVEKARMLIKAGANVNARDKTGATPLVHAASNHYYNLGKVLIAAGGTLPFPIEKADTLLSIALREMGLIK